jgi:hypothetical protein
MEDGELVKNIDTLIFNGLRTFSSSQDDDVRIITFLKNRRSLDMITDETYISALVYFDTLMRVYSEDKDTQPASPRGVLLDFAACIYVSAKQNEDPGGITTRRLSKVPCKTFPDSFSQTELILSEERVLRMLDYRLMIHPSIYNEYFKLVSPVSFPEMKQGHFASMTPVRDPSSNYMEMQTFAAKISSSSVELCTEDFDLECTEDESSIY